MLVLWLALAFWIPNMWGQADVSSVLGYPDFIIYNAKIVTMDDPSFESRVGTIAQAMAVRGSEVLAVGANAEIRKLAGPQTKQMDLRGRTVLPSFMMTHEHPTDWAFAQPESLRHAFPADKDFLIMRWLEGNGEQQFSQWENVLREAVAKAKPGQWVWVSFFWGSNYEHVDDIWQRFGEDVTKEKVDRIAPNNPVMVKNSWPLSAVINQKAQELLEKAHPDLKTALTPIRFVEPDVIFQGQTRDLANILKAELELWDAFGITAFGSSAYAAGNFQALSLLDRNGEMPARFAWAYTGPNFSIDVLRYASGLVGNGTPYLWNVGAWATSGGDCSTIQASPEIKARESCNFEPGKPGRKITEDIIRVGGRVATMHTGSDKDIDYYMDAIVKASEEGGLTIEDIRARRHAFDHASGAPRRDQLPAIKNLGMLVSMINTMLWENHREYNTSQRVRDYGSEFATLSVPRKSVTDAGVKNTFEIDRPLPHLVFTMIHKGITRYSDKDKRVYGPSEATDRIIQLKALTTWGSYYLLREKVMGSLERGKYADFIVLDRDYLTVPENEIPKLQVLMTVVGGKTRHLLPSLAQEIGTAPVGPTTWPTKPLERMRTP
ncbi:MAG: amidohydrolase family protein [Acidobacteria bacterium]|nr:amidohydrolase family protein [Acidobacteriota bacterium]